MEVIEIRGRSSMIPRNPWSLLINAFFYAAFGFVLVAWPGATLSVLYITFGIFAICYGVFQMVGVFTSRGGREEKEGEEEEKARPDWLTVPIALVALIAGVMALAWPGATSTVILVILGIWAIGTGIIEFAAGLRLPKGFRGKALILVIALLSVGFGIYFLVGPENKGANEVASTAVILVGVYGLVKGVLIAVYAFMLRSLYKKAEKAA